jgi:ABC-type phosphate transport system substrate-binding protein
MFKRTMIAASLAVAALTSVQAMADIVGGGASLPANLYNGTSTLPRLLPADFIYTSSSSGTGKTAFLSNPSTFDFAGSDSVLTATELASYNAANGAAFGKLIQIPAVGTSVAIPYKHAGVTSLQVTAAQLCDVFSGTITTWGQLLGTGAADQTLIKVIYRSGSSGTTELFTRFLNDTCPTQFSVNGTFTTAAAKGAPANSIIAAGSGDVVTTVNATEGAIGYVSPDYVNANSNAVVARVSKTAMAAGTAPLPTFANARTALGTAVAPGTAAGTTPEEAAVARANPLKWVPTFGSNVAGGDSPVPTAAGAYPIVGYTNFLVGQCYANPADATAIRNFLNDLYTGAKSTIITQHSFVSLPAAFAAEVKKTFLDNGYNQGLDIANASVCNGVGRP